jgi:hypothetical protein
MASGGSRLLKPITNRDDITTMRRKNNKIVAARQWKWDPALIRSLVVDRDNARAVIVLRALLGEAAESGLTRATKTEMMMMIMAAPEPSEDVAGPTVA